MTTSNRTLICWLGGNDIKAIDGNNIGPILATLQKVTFDTLYLLNSYSENIAINYTEWLRTKINIDINLVNEELSSPTDFKDIYLAASKNLDLLKNQNIHPNILISPGTPAMQAVWILLGKTKFTSTFYQSSIEQGVSVVNIPFDISAEYIPTAKSIDSKKLSDLHHKQLPINVAFENILTNNPNIQQIKNKAQILADKDVPVLIYGETGTGKELFARAIHNASKRAEKPFIAVNCGALPEELADSILFGHKKGAFTGAITDKKGLFSEANGGTLFLDEFAELPPSIQVKLLRVLQESTFNALGSNEEETVNVRIITATHQDLLQLVIDGKFREDLFYRVAVGIIQLPPIRQREGDLIYLAEKILERIANNDISLKHKFFSVGAKNIILKHAWNGNIRELQSTILRAAIWGQENSISGNDMEEALFFIPKKTNEIKLSDIKQGVDLQRIISELTIEYIREALIITNHNKTRSAELLGLKNYQTLNNWMEKYGVK